MTLHLCHSFAASRRVFRHRHEQVGAKVSMPTELWYNLEGPEQQCPGLRLGLAKIVEACEGKEEPGIFAIDKEETREH